MLKVAMASLARTPVRDALPERFVLTSRHAQAPALEVSQVLYSSSGR